MALDAINPSDISESGDIDGEPLDFSCSLSATVFMMGVAQPHGDMDFANALGQAFAHSQR